MSSNNWLAWAIGDKLGRDVRESWEYIAEKKKEDEFKRQAAAREDELKFASEMSEIDAEIAQEESDRRVRELAAQLKQRNEDIEAIKRDLKGQLANWMAAQLTQSRLRKEYQQKAGISTEQFNEDYRRTKKEVLAEKPEIAAQLEDRKKLYEELILKEYGNGEYTKEKALEYAKKWDIYDSVKEKIEAKEKEPPYKQQSISKKPF